MMPIRKIHFETGQIYHIFNKTIESKKIFNDDYLCSAFAEIVRYYRCSTITCRFSQFKKLSNNFKNLLLKNIQNSSNYNVEILCYCLMPTHFHFLLKQNVTNGVTKFCSDALNSFTRYFNIKNKRMGPIFLPRFKAVKIKNETQLKHVSRYIHLNPYSDGLITNINNLINYQWSSLKEYVFSNSERLSSPDLILNLFKNKRSRYKKFVLDNDDYQKILEYAKHTVFTPGVQFTINRQRE